MVWKPGDKLQNGKYTINRELGRGRFGITYLAKHEDGYQLVIKTLNDELLASVSPTERDNLESNFWDEAVKLARSQHSHIVKVRQPFKERQRSCIVMEYIDGFSLADRAEKKLDEKVALGYIQQIGEALIAVHKNGLIHRDVKPGNILLRPKGGRTEAVLIDFGLALEFDRNLSTVRTKQASEGFAPPELYSRHGGDIGPHTDVYFLAATLYDLLTGTPPISALERKSELNSNNKDPLTAPIGLNPKISPVVNQAIIKGMELDSKERPQSIKDWLELLGLTVEATSINEPSSRPLSFEQKIAIGTLFVGIIAAIGALSGWIPVFKSDPPSVPVQSSPAPSISSPTKTP